MRVSVTCLLHCSHCAYLYMRRRTHANVLTFAVDHLALSANAVIPDSCRGQRDTNASRLKPEPQSDARTGSLKPLQLAWPMQQSQEIEVPPSTISVNLTPSHGRPTPTCAAESRAPRPQRHRGHGGQRSDEECCHGPQLEASRVAIVAPTFARRGVQVATGLHFRRQGVTTPACPWTKDHGPPF